MELLRCVFVWGWLVFYMFFFCCNYLDVWVLRVIIWRSGNYWLLFYLEVGVVCFLCFWAVIVAFFSYNLLLVCGWLMGCFFIFECFGIPVT